MADLNIPNKNKKNNKYIFKRKLPLRRKSKSRLFTEFVFMFCVSLLLVYINYLIPNKILLLQNLPTAFNKILLLFIQFCSMLPEILLVIFMFASLLSSLFLMIGSFYRIVRILNRKTKKISYK